MRNNFPIFKNWPHRVENRMGERAKADKGLVQVVLQPSFFIPCNSTDGTSYFKADVENKVVRSLPGSQQRLLDELYCHLPDRKFKLTIKAANAGHYQRTAGHFGQRLQKDLFTLGGSKMLDDIGHFQLFFTTEPHSARSVAESKFDFVFLVQCKVIA